MRDGRTSTRPSSERLHEVSRVPELDAVLLVGELVEERAALLDYVAIQADHFLSFLTFPPPPYGVEGLFLFIGKYQGGRFSSYRADRKQEASVDRSLHVEQVTSDMANDVGLFALLDPHRAVERQ